MLTSLPNPRGSAHILGAWLALAAITMLFAGLTSAYAVSEGASDTWGSLRFSPLLWLSTAALVIADVSLGAARRQRRRPLLALSLAAGLLFCLSQVALFFSFWTSGMRPSTNLHLGYFYLLLGLHGIHVIGGVGLQGYLAARSGAADMNALDVAWLYWRFLDLLWIYLLVLLFV